MDIKVENGAQAMGPNGLPLEVSGLEELLQRARFRLTIPLGGFSYDRGLGSRLHELNPGEAHGEERALAYANEALREMGGACAEQVRLEEGAAVFTVATPLGGGEVRVPVPVEKQEEGGGANGVV